MKIVAFLQCQWVKDPARIAKLYEMRGGTPEKRAELNAMLLFWKSKTGRVLQSVLGEEMCDRIIWEEVTTQIAGHSSGVFAPDPQHIRSVLDHFSPDLVISFGKVAGNALRELWAGELIECMHPAARGAGVRSSIEKVRTRLLKGQA